ncbi:MAG TPA: hypothetical protein VJJ82_05615 [Candidatus Nanoarchaeia archaeon]|nr:hypothetical protein [Candidatus Nanoarchaeia archaeon]
MTDQTLEERTTIRFPSPQDVSKTEALLDYLGQSIGLCSYTITQTTRKRTVSTAEYPNLATGENNGVIGIAQCNVRCEGTITQASPLATVDFESPITTKQEISALQILTRLGYEWSRILESERNLIERIQKVAEEYFKSGT